MRILMASAEVAPFARVGGLSDVVGALSKALAGLGHDVVVVVPKYAVIEEVKWGIRRVDGCARIAVPLGDRSEEIAIHECRMPGAETIRVLLIEHEGAFGRDGIYVDPSTGRGYSDEAERYALFSRAILECARVVGLAPEVVHLNDHHTALAAVYMREFLREDATLSVAGVVFSIHNLGYTGWFDKALLPKIGFPEERCVFGSPFEYQGGVSTLKLGIEYADYVNTVSPRYAVEISSSPEYGLGLEGVLAERRASGRLVGILNGVDYDVWDPRVDTLIPARYGPDDLSGKLTCKMDLLERSGLDPDPAAPLIGMVSRLAGQKGFDLLEDAGDAIVELGARLVILGTGESKYEAFLEELASRHAGRVAVHLAFDNEFAHGIEAGADMFLMPSRYEPCGLNQMYSLRYGTVPIVRATGGLADTVEDYDPASDTGVGFVFEAYDAEALLEAVGRAVDVFRDRARWEGLMRRGMALDFGWEASAGKYVELYGRARDARAAAI